MGKSKLTVDAITSTSATLKLKDLYEESETCIIKLFYRGYPGIPIPNPCGETACPTDCEHLSLNNLKPDTQYLLNVTYVKDATNEFSVEKLFTTCNKLKE